VNIIFLPEAQAEFLDAISYYEAARKGLGWRFLRMKPIAAFFG
jgi:hypothetical protein